MKTPFKVTVTTALAMALICPVNMALAQGFSFPTAGLKSTRSTVSKTRNAKVPARSAPSKSRIPAKTFTKPSNTFAKPSKTFTKPSKPISKPAPVRNTKSPSRSYQPIKFPIKTIPPEKKSRVTPPAPKRRVPDATGNNRRPDPRVPIIDPRLVENLERIGRTRRPVLDPETVRNITEIARERNARAEEEALEVAPDVERDLEPGEENLVPPAAGAPDHPACRHGCHGHCNHHGPSFGLDFPRWGFAYGPNGIYIRGGGRRYIDRPGNVVIVDGGNTVVEESGVEIREVNDLPEVYVATTIALSSKLPLGNEIGQVILDIQGISLPTELRAWTNESATCTLPMMGLDQPKEARLIMITAQGEVAHSISVLLMPAKAPAENPLD
jgi:hypothetical protein